MQTEEQLINMIALFKVCLEMIHDFAENKQQQRAEPWQQTVIDMSERALNKYERFLKGADL